MPFPWFGSFPNGLSRAQLCWINLRAAVAMIFGIVFWTGVWRLADLVESSWSRNLLLFVVGVGGALFTGVFFKGAKMEDVVNMPTVIVSSWPSYAWALAYAFLAQTTIVFQWLGAYSLVQDQLLGGKGGDTVFVMAVPLCVCGLFALLATRTLLFTSALPVPEPKEPIDVSLVSSASYIALVCRGVAAVLGVNTLWLGVNTLVIEGCKFSILAMYILVVLSFVMMVLTHSLFGQANFDRSEEGERVFLVRPEVLARGMSGDMLHAAAGDLEKQQRAGEGGDGGVSGKKQRSTAAAGSADAGSLLSSAADKAQEPLSRQQSSEDLAAERIASVLSGSLSVSQPAAACQPAPLDVSAVLPSLPHSDSVSQRLAANASDGAVDSDALLGRAEPAQGAPQLRTRSAADLQQEKAKREGEQHAAALRDPAHEGSGGQEGPLRREGALSALWTAVLSPLLVRARLLSFRRLRKSRNIPLLYHAQGVLALAAFFSFWSILDNRLSWLINSPGGFLDMDHLPAAVAAAAADEATWAAPAAGGEGGGGGFEGYGGLTIPGLVSVAELPALAFAIVPELSNADQLSDPLSPSLSSSPSPAADLSDDSALSPTLPPTPSPSSADSSSDVFTSDDPPTAEPAVDEELTTVITTITTEAAPEEEFATEAPSLDPSISPTPSPSLALPTQPPPASAASALRDQLLLPLVFVLTGTIGALATGTFFGNSKVVLEYHGAWDG